MELNSAGGIRVHFKFDDANRLQINTILGPNIEFANAQPHIIKFQRIEGKILRLQVRPLSDLTMHCSLVTSE